MLNDNPRKAPLLNKHRLVPITWLIMLYIGTALTAGVDTSPKGGVALIIFETRHVIMHLLAFAIQAWLIGYGLGMSSDHHNRSIGIWLIMVVLILGIGQEALQSLYRHEIRLLASLWDLTVDTTGGVIGWWWHKHQRTRLRSQYSKAMETGSGS